MSKKKRVGAIMSATKDAVKFLGYGNYDGDFKPTVPVMGIPVEELSEGLKNPRITLDNGDTVWGCQCWWGSEREVKREFGGRKIINVRIADFMD